MFNQLSPSYAYCHDEAIPEVLPDGQFTSGAFWKSTIPREGSSQESLVFILPLKKAVSFHHIYIADGCQVD